MSVVVCDTTPLNYLILIGNSDVLPQLFGRLLVPPAVIGEMRHSRAPAAVAEWMSNLPSWIEIREPRTDLRLGVGAGEDEAISSLQATTFHVEAGFLDAILSKVKARKAAQ